jgi:hypothetical protein
MGDQETPPEDEYTLCQEVYDDTPRDDPTEETLCTLLLQRQEYLEYHVPPIREELQPSPYAQFTEYQVNMRRKAEILSYKNKPDTNGSFTKSQKWSNLAKNVRQLSTKTQQNCPDSSLLFSLSSSCDVPGPIITLYRDATVPLYNYGFNPPNFNLQNAVPLPEWNAFPKYDSEFKNNTPNIVANLVIQNPKNRNYIYQIQTPISVNIDGNINPSGTKVDSIQLSISNPTFAVYFTNALVPNIMPIVFLNVQPISVSLQNSSNGQFSASVYSGMVNVSNFALSTQPQFVYNLEMSFNADFTLYDSQKNKIVPGSSNITISTIDVILNLTDITDPSYISFSNCLVKSVSSVPFVPFTLVGRKT